MGIWEHIASIFVFYSFGVATLLLIWVTFSGGLDAEPSPRALWVSRAAITANSRALIIFFISLSGHVHHGHINSFCYLYR